MTELWKGTYFGAGQRPAVAIAFMTGRQKTEVLEMIDISIIVPVYCVEKYLRQSVQSMRNQIHKNIEIILVDDGSPDRSGEICDELAPRKTGFG